MVGDMVTRTPFRGRPMITASGHPIYVATPRVEDIRIDDIAAQLSRECRWGGALRDEIEHYSVAQHSVYVSVWIKTHPEWQAQGPYGRRMLERAALLHDAEEYALKDIPKPLKPYIKGYEELADNVRNVIFNAFGLPEGVPACVKDADKEVCSAERRDIRAPIVGDWETAEWCEPATVKIQPVRPSKARRMFLKRFAEVFG